MLKPLHQLKAFRILFLLTFLGTQNIFGQDTDIDKNWTNLKTQFEIRKGIIDTLVTLISKSSQEKQQLNELQLVSVDFFNYIDTLILRDSLSISIANLRNKKIEKTLEEIFLKFENNKRVMNKKTVLDLITQLEASENKITVAKTIYNKACNLHKRTDLLFDYNETYQVPQVRF